MNSFCTLCGSDKSILISTKLRHQKSGRIVKCACGLIRLEGAGSQQDANNFYTNQYSEEYYEGIKAKQDSLFESFMPVQAHRINKLSPFLS